MAGHKFSFNSTNIIFFYQKKHTMLGYEGLKAVLLIRKPAKFNFLRVLSVVTIHLEIYSPDIFYLNFMF